MLWMICHYFQHFMREWSVVDTASDCWLSLFEMTQAVHLVKALPYWTMCTHTCILLLMQYMVSKRQQAHLLWCLLSVHCSFTMHPSQLEVAGEGGLISNPYTEIM